MGTNEILTVLGMYKYTTNLHLGGPRTKLYYKYFYNCLVHIIHTVAYILNNDKVQTRHLQTVKGHTGFVMKRSQTTRGTLKIHTKTL